MVRVLADTNYLMDGDSNCFTSIHVSLSSLAYYGLYKSAGKISGLFLLWPILVWISTLTTKQHYVLDLISGIVVAVILLWIVKFFLRRAPRDLAGKAI